MINGTFGPCITFLPPPEAATVPPENILRFNGHLPFAGTYSSVSNDFAPVFSGQYTCWGFEHILIRPTQPASVAHFTAALKASLQIKMDQSPYSIPLHRMRATRSSTGGVVTPE